MIGSQWADEQRALWQRIASHPFDAPHEALDFTRRLAREQAWTLAYARQAIEEYRRFCFLVMVTGQAVTPSQDVDEVWHLHLTYSRDYWDVWCARILQRRLHHDPTEGGPAEAAKFREQYATTLKSYECWFGPSPEAIWPSSQQRFATRPRFRTVDTQRVMILPKPRLPAAWRMPLAVFLAMLLVPWQVLALPSNPLDWPGPPFLALFAGECLIAGLFAMIWRQILRSSGDTGAHEVELDPVELGFLAGGPKRAFDTGLTELMVAGVVSLDASKRLRVTAQSGPPINGFQRAIQDGATYRDARRAAGGVVTAIRNRLAAQGLALTTRMAMRAAWLPLLVFIPVLPLAGLKIQAGLSRGHPVGFLVMAVVLAVLTLLWSVRRQPWRTRAGDDALKDMRALTKRLARAPQQAELSLAVALVGPAILLGTPYAAYAQMTGRGSGGSDSGCGSSDSGGGDSGGDGGSGCGGCSS